MLSEAVLIALLGGLLAVIAAKVIYQFVGLGDMLALFLQNFRISPATIAIAMGASALIGLVSGGIPAWNVARIKIVDGLRRVG
jgi:putative ABC transport system permease protein